MNKEKPTVFIIEDDPAVIHSLKALLESVHLHVETFNNAQDYLSQYEPDCCGCVLVDVRLSGMSGLDLLDQLKEKHCLLPIIVMTAYGDIPMAVRALQSGAMNFITKPFNDQVLLDNIQKAIQQSQQKSTNSHSELSQYIHLFHQLTTREKEILKMLAEGKFNKQIAGQLDIALSTVELYRSHILKKMKVNNVLALVRIYALIERLITSK